MEKNEVEYFGIADAHGLESFIPKGEMKKDTLIFLYLRAQANRHRHALLYRAILIKEDAKEIEILFKNKEYAKALKLLKQKARKIFIPKTFNVKSWYLIPNSMLDPWA